MDRYDVIMNNGQKELVKIFPWYSYCSALESKISLHCGVLRVLNTGDEVPYHSAAYNYGKNFAIVDLSPVSVSDDMNNWMVHIIRDGRYFKSFTSIDYKPEDELLLSNSPKVIRDYDRAILKISFIEDIEKYKKDVMEAAIRVDDITIEIEEKYDCDTTAYEVEYEKVRPSLDSIYAELDRKWTCPVTKAEKRYTEFGQWMFAGLLILHEMEAMKNSATNSVSIFDILLGSGEAMKCKEQDCTSALLNIPIWTNPSWTYAEYQELFADYSNDFLSKFTDWNETFMNEYFHCMGISNDEKNEVHNLLDEISKSGRKGEEKK